jgi:hypothetical protein
MSTHRAVTQLVATGPLSLCRVGPHQVEAYQLLVKIEAVALNVCNRSVMNDFANASPLVARRTKSYG